MYIIDLEGRTIEVTDIDGAIKQTALFMGYTYEDKEASLKRLEQQRQRYWRDVHDKLLILKNGLEKAK